MLFRSVPQRPEKGSNRKFLLLIDMYVADIVNIERKFDPRSAEGDDSRTVELGAVGMNVLFEHDPRRAKIGRASCRERV